MPALSIWQSRIRDKIEIKGWIYLAQELLGDVRKLCWLKSVEIKYYKLQLNFEMR